MEKRTKKHPVLGTLTSVGSGEWLGKVMMRGFGRGKWARALKVSIDSHEAEAEKRAIELAAALVERSSHLTNVLLDGLWREFSGEEPQGTSWWARDGGLALANKWLEKPLKTRDDLVALLRPYCLFVRADYHGDGELVAGLTFHCEFEQEHGLDVLTDGDQVLGTGYATDAQKYERFWTITRAERDRRAKEAMARFQAARAAAQKRQSE
jgi:hypothetical protein